MRLLSLQLNTLEDLYVEQLKDLYSVERKIIDALPEMIDAASSLELKNNFKEHLEQTREQAQRLELIFEQMDMEPETTRCEGIEGIIKEAEKIIEAGGDADVKDAALIGAVQKVEHDEISRYETTRTLARVLGYDDAVELLQKTLDQELHTDRILSEVAERSINLKASGA